VICVTFCESTSRYYVARFENKTVWIVRKRIDTGRHSYRSDLVGQGFAGPGKKKRPKVDSDATENEPGGDSVIDQISGDPYLADLIRKHRQE